MTVEHLRPIERAVQRLADEGMTNADIAWRFRRSPGHIERILALSRLPRTGERTDHGNDTLRPIERCVVRARSNGVDAKEIAARMRRTPDYVERVEQFAAYKMERGRA